MENIEKVNVKYLANALNLKNLAKVKSDLKPERIFANMNKKKTKTTRRMKTFKTKNKNKQSNERASERTNGGKIEQMEMENNWMVFQLFDFSVFGSVV